MVPKAPLLVLAFRPQGGHGGEAFLNLVYINKYIYYMLRKESGVPTPQNQNFKDLQGTLRVRLARFKCTACASVFKQELKPNEALAPKVQCPVCANPYVIWVNSEEFSIDKPKGV